MSPSLSKRGPFSVEFALIGVFVDGRKFYSMASTLAGRNWKVLFDVVILSLIGVLFHYYFAPNPNISCQYIDDGIQLMWWRCCYFASNICSCIYVEDNLMSNTLFHLNIFEMEWYEYEFIFVTYIVHLLKMYNSNIIYIYIY